MKSISKLDLNLLKTFNVLMDERNVSKAAKRLAVSQPAVSGMLTRLRESLDDPLFIRSQQGVIPTERALELAGPIRRVLRELADIIQPSVFVPEEADFTLKLAGTDYSLSVIIIPLIERLKTLAPKLKVSTRIIDDDHVLLQMENAQLDFAFMRPELIPTGLIAQALFDERYVCVLGQENPLAEKPSLTLDEFCSADHALVSTVGGAFQGATDRALQAIDRKRNVAVSVPSSLLLLELLKKTDLVAVVPKRLVRDCEGVKVMNIPLIVAGFSQSLVWHERIHHQPAYRWVRQLILEQ